MDDLTQIGLQRSSEKINWMVAAQSVHFHPINSITGNPTQGSVLCSTSSADGASGNY